MTGNNDFFPIIQMVDQETKMDVPIPSAFLDTAPICILLLDEQNRIVFANKFSWKLFTDPAKMLGHFIWKLCYNETDMGTLNLFLESGSEHALSIMLRGKDQNSLHVKIYTSRFQDKKILFLEDNTENYLLEEELCNFKAAVNFAADAIFLFDERGMIFLTNPAFEGHVRMKSEEIIGKKVEDFWVDHVPSLSFLWEEIQNGKTWSGEIKCLRKNEDALDVEILIRPIYTETQLFIAFVCVQRNITERKQMEKRLADYSQNLQRLVDERTEALTKLHEISQLFHSTDTLEKRLKLVLIAVTAGETFGFNRAFLLLFNHNKDALEGKIAIGPSSPEEAGRVWSYVSKLPHDGTILGRLEVYLKHSDARIDEYANYIVRQLDTPLSNNTSILVKAVTLDRSFIVNEGESVVDFDRSIIQILGTNAFAVIPLVVRNIRIGVIVADNVITRNPIKPEDVQMLDILATQAALAIAHANSLEELARKIQETEYAYAELRRSQEKLIESGKFAALGQMAATVAHEIRTPLVAIGGFANLLKNKFNEEKQDEKTLHYINIISEESKRLEDVLNRLLFYARPSTPNMYSQDYNGFVLSILSFMHKDIEMNKITVQFNPDPALPLVPLDRNLLRQVLINIIQNAIQSMENGGTLFVSTFHENREWATLVIKDTGIGIAEENIGRIFEPFFSTKHAGTGLGLHVSQRIIANHKGTIQITSQLGVGTAVTIRLPAREA